jgi:hypothetical protein
MKLSKGLISIFLVMALLAFHHQTGVAQPPTPEITTLSLNKNFLGLHIHRATQAPWPTFDFAGWRLLDAGVSWRSIQPERNTFDFSRLDVWTRMSEIKGIELTYVFYATPPWASARPTEAGANGLGSAAVPANIDDWRKYIRAVVTRYKGRIKYYEIWNEPNWKNFYTGTWTQLAALVHEAAIIIKEGDPAAQIILPGLASEHGLTVIDDFLRTGVGRDIDIVGYHFYTGHRPPEVLFDMVNKLRTSLAKVGLDKKPVWNTEFGWLVEGQGRTINAAAAGFSRADPVYSDEVAASFVVRSFAILSSMGIERSYFYAWDNESMGVFDPKTKQIKPALTLAFQSLNRWLKNPLLRCEKKQGIYLCPFSSAMASEALVWSDGKPLNISNLTKDWRSIEDMQGNVFDLHNTSALKVIGSGPYLLR